MKTIASAVLGLSFALVTAGVSLAAQTATTPAPASDNSSKPAVVKKHVKKNKKAPVTANSSATTPASAATPAK